MRGAWFSAWQIERLFICPFGKNYQKRIDSARTLTEKQAVSHTGWETKRSLNGRILRHTTLNLLMLVAICRVIMALSMQSLANCILLDSLQPMARQSAKTAEANIHMLADPMMTIAGDSRMNAARESRGGL